MVGRYRAIVVSSGLRKSKGKGTPSIGFKFFIKFPVDDPTQEVKATIYHDLWLTPATMDRTLKCLDQVFGWNGFDIQELAQPIFNGKECDLVLDEEEYDGKVVTRVQFVNSTGAFKALDPEELQGVIDEVGPLLRNLRGVQEATAAGDPMAASVPLDKAVTDEDPLNENLPF